MTVTAVEFPRRIAGLSQSEGSPHGDMTPKGSIVMLRGLRVLLIDLAATADFDPGSQHDMEAAISMLDRVIPTLNGAVNGPAAQVRPSVPDLPKSPKPKPDPNRITAKDFISAQLSSGPKYSSEIKSAAQAAGLNFGSVSACASTQGVVKKLVGKSPRHGSIWSLPEGHPLKITSTGGPE